jgi:predicted RNA-binding protein with PUA-like domain
MVLCTPQADGTKAVIFPYRLNSFKMIAAWLAPVPPAGVPFETMRYWLFKSEPDVYSIDDLARDGVTYWDGVRNYQARNLLRDEIAPGDQVLFYHSNAEPPAIAGLAEVVRGGYGDPSALDPKHKYHDAKSTPANPIWFVVDIRFVRKFSRPLPLPSLRDEALLEGMMLLQKGSRLSVQPVSPAHFKTVLALAK